MPYLWVEMSGSYLLPGLASNHDPPDLYLPSSVDYDCMPLWLASNLVHNVNPKLSKIKAK
jgi:hypothetical protein